MQITALTLVVDTDGSKVFGFQDPKSPIGWNLTPEVQQLISSLMTVGAFTGSLMAGPMSIWLTRRWCIWVACLLCCASNGIMMGTTNLSGIYAGRFLIGVANGFYMVRHLASLLRHADSCQTFGQLYIQEVIPARYRGASIAAFNVFTSVGTLVGTVVDNFTSKIEGRNCYLIPLALIFIVPTIISIGLLFIPETPAISFRKANPNKHAKPLSGFVPKVSTLMPSCWKLRLPPRRRKKLRILQAGSTFLEILSIDDAPCLLWVLCRLKLLREPSS